MSKQMKGLPIVVAKKTNGDSSDSFSARVRQLQKRVENLKKQVKDLQPLVSEYVAAKEKRQAKRTVLSKTILAKNDKNVGRLLKDIDVQMISLVDAPANGKALKWKDSSGALQVNTDQVSKGFLVDVGRQAIEAADRSNIKKAMTLAEDIAKHVSTL